MFRNSLILNERTVAISLGTSFTLFQNINSPKALKRALQSGIGNVMGSPFGKWMKLICFQNGGLALEGIRDQYISNDEAEALLAGQGLRGEIYLPARLLAEKEDKRKKLISDAK